MSRNKVDGVSKKQLVAGAFVFASCYLILLVIILCIILLTHTSSWVDYVKNNVSRVLTLGISSLLLYCIVYYYYYFENRSFFAKMGNIYLVFTVLTLCIFICYLFGNYVSIYMRPEALLALLFVFLLNRRQAIVLNFVFSILLFVVDMYTIEFVEVGIDNARYLSLMLSFVSGTFAVFAAGKVKTRGGVLFTGCVIAIPTLIIVTLLKLPTAYNDWIDFVTAIGFSALGCILSAVLALALLPVLEFSFNRLTVFRLRELTSTNAPILMRLKTEAPGTFNHSLIVAQLSESCAVAIGENAELARAAAYYHDVGKLKQPDCFTENQSGYNVHDELMPELSADIIRSHARDGYDLLVSAHLPEEIASVAREHHGTLPIKYFYDKAIRLSGGDADIKDYSYLGPTPQTKIAAIVMIADAAEASTRALKDRSPENVERTVRGIIEERMDLDQFGECNITLRELAIIRQTLVEALSGVHHHRVEYPAIRFNREKKAVREEAAETEDDK